MPSQKNDTDSNPDDLDTDPNRNLKITLVEVRETKAFSRWLTRLRDERALVRINLRLDRVKRGLLGDVKPVGHGVSEMRIDYGPGYRIYFTQQGSELILLLCGGDKGSQRKDIALAKKLLMELDS
jgi:putative addiction module killer protein